MITQVDIQDIFMDMNKALTPLIDIADAYDKNELDGEARKYWGVDHEGYTNCTSPEKIELFQGRGGRQLLTLADCLAARDVYRKMQKLGSL